MSRQILVAEFKTGPKNPDFRGALAQAMDYGADLWGMSYDEFETTVALQYFGGAYCPNGAPSRHAGSLFDAAEATWGDSWPEEDRSQFCERVRVALDAGRFHFAVVAQRFTSTMERTAEYLNSTGTDRAVKPSNPRTRKESRLRARKEHSFRKRLTTTSSGLSIAMLSSSKLCDRIMNDRRPVSSACQSRPSISRYEQAVIWAWRKEPVPSL